VVSIVAEIDSRIKSLNDNAGLDTPKKLTDEAQELRARVLLGKHEQPLLDEIENKKKSAAYGECIEETRPTTITQKSSAVTKAVVSEQLKQSFKAELRNLDFTHIEVELKEVGGAEGVFYHRLVLTRNSSYSAMVTGTISIPWSCPMCSMMLRGTSRSAMK
jgi:hypothetical protein